jgi:capsular exopolysaccharide synthesis family protein
MSKILNALARKEAEVPSLALARLIDELERTKDKLRRAEPESDRAESSVEAAIRTQRLQIEAQSPLLPFDGSHQEAAEQYRIVRTRITQHSKQPSMLVVASAGAGDGRTVTAINVAASLSLKSEGDVLLVDADFRRSSVHKQLGLSPSPGLGELIEGHASLERAAIRAEQFPHLYILPAGNPASNPGELLDSSRWKDLAKQLRQLFEYVILDSPPVRAVADYELIQAVCDGTLLVLRPDHTRRHMAAEALEAIPRERLIGVVMNCVPNWFLRQAEDRLR